MAIDRRLLVEAVDRKLGGEIVVDPVVAGSSGLLWIDAAGGGRVAISGDSWRVRGGSRGFAPPKHVAGAKRRRVGSVTRRVAGWDALAQIVGRRGVHSHRALPTAA